MSRPGWRWSEQYEAYPSVDEDVDVKPNCGRQTLKHDDYYCNKELMQLLVFDAKATNNSFRGDYVENLPPRARNLAHLYGIFIRFIATQSGLTRWHYLKASRLSNADDDIVFGDLHRRAVNEPWYKSAIFQNELDSDSISLSGKNVFNVDRKEFFIINIIYIYIFFTLNIYIYIYLEFTYFLTTCFSSKRI